MKMWALNNVQEAEKKYKKKYMRGWGSNYKGFGSSLPTVTLCLIKAKLGSSLCVEKRDLEVVKGWCLLLSQLMSSIFSKNIKTLGSCVTGGFMVLPVLSYSGGIRGPQTGRCVKSLWYLNASGKHDHCHMKWFERRRKWALWKEEKQNFKDNFSGPAPLSHSTLCL